MKSHECLKHIPALDVVRHHLTIVMNVRHEMRLVINAQRRDIFLQFVALLGQCVQFNIQIIYRTILTTSWVQLRQNTHQ